MNHAVVSSASLHVCVGGIIHGLIDLVKETDSLSAKCYETAAAVVVIVVVVVVNHPPQGWSLRA